MTFSVLAFAAELDPSPSASAVNVKRLAAAAEAAGAPEDPPERRVAVLPERFWRDGDEAAYRAAVSALARRWDAWVVGGSMRAERPDGTARNTGVVAAPDGTIKGAYAKRRPFAAEALVGVTPGEGPAAFALGGAPVAVCICADLFDPGLLAACPPDCAVVLVCACSTSRKPAPDFARALWTHVAVARAWERNAYVVVSDWAPAPHLPGVRTSGVGGLADPCRDTPPLFTPVPPPAVWFRLELESLGRLERDRLARKFLWR